MKVKCLDLLRSSNSLAALRQMKLKPAAALTMARVIKAVDAELETFEQVRMKLLDEHHAFLPEGANKYKFPEGEQAQFDADWKVCLEMEVDLPFGCVDFDAMGLSAIEPAILEPLLWLFASGEENDRAGS